MRASRSRREGLRLGAEPIAGTAHRLDHVCAVGGPERFAQPIHVHVDRALLVEDLVAPDAIDHQRAAADSPGLRRRRGRPAQPTTVFVPATGALDLGAPVFTATDPIVILTTPQGADRLGSRTGPARVEVIGAKEPTGRDIVAALARDPDRRTILTEGGPTLFGRLLRDGVIDEMFQTVAPQIAGRSREAPRLALVEGVTFTPAAAPWSRLVSVKRSPDGLLFLRYALAGQERASSTS